MPKEEHSTGVTPLQKKEKPISEGTPDGDKELPSSKLHEAPPSPRLCETPTSRPERNRSGRPSRQRQGRSPKGTFLESSGEKRESRPKNISPADSSPTPPSRSSSRSTRGKLTSGPKVTGEHSATKGRPPGVKHPRGYNLSLSGGQYAAMFPTDQLEVDINVLEPELQEQVDESEKRKSEQSRREANLLQQRLKAVQHSTFANSLLLIVV